MENKESTPVTEEQTQRCLAETHKHVRRVQEFLNIFIKELIDRGANHDNSKFESPELDIFAANTGKLSNTEYGTPEYQASLNSARSAINHHYSCPENGHHPEHWPNGVEDMDLLDILEALADWRASGDRNKNGNIHKSIAVNAERFNISPQLRKILQNTANKYF